LSSSTIVYADERLASYNFGEEHPFGPARYSAFYDEFIARGLNQRCIIGRAVIAERSSIELFHKTAYIKRVIEASKTGAGYLDQGDTPAVKDIYEAAVLVVGSVLDGVDKLVKGECQRAFIPIAGLHHASRDSAAGFCVFNDCGIAIEACTMQAVIQQRVSASSMTAASPSRLCVVDTTSGASLMSISTPTMATASSTPSKRIRT